MKARANCTLIPRRTLQTWQMIFACCASNRIFCSSQNPISRSRWLTSGGAESCLMRTAVPARTSLSGQMNGWGHSGLADTVTTPSFIADETRLVETELQEAFASLPDITVRAAHPAIHARSVQRL